MKKIDVLLGLPGSAGPVTLRADEFQGPKIPDLVTMELKGYHFEAQGGADGSASARRSLVVTKQVDVTTPGLMSLCAQGVALPEVKLCVNRTGHGVSASLMGSWATFKLSQAVVSSVEWSASDGDAVVEEQVTIGFTKVEVEYVALRDAGGAGSSTTGGGGKPDGGGGGKPSTAGGGGKPPTGAGGGGKPDAGGGGKPDAGGGGKPDAGGGGEPDTGGGGRPPVVVVPGKPTVTTPTIGGGTSAAGA